MDTDVMQGHLGLLMQKADHIYAASDKIMYLGFCQPGTTGTDESKWAICKIEYSATTEPYTLTIKWANGQRQKALIFDNYASYTYTYKKF